MHKKIGLLFCFLVFWSFSFGQNTFQIKGVIKDKKETIPGAAVYLSGYKMAVVTDGNGQFTLPNLLPGNYDVLVQAIGYLPYSKNIIISDKSLEVEMILTENPTLLKEVVIKPDPNRAYYMNLFKNYFIGRTPNAAQCKILNPEVLSYNDDRVDRMLTFEASDFLIIENQALGYRIKYLLKYFEYNYRTKVFFYAGHPTFEDLKGSKSRQKKWQKNRIVAYNGSIQHFFQSLYQNRITEEGFVINKRKTVKNPNKLPDSLINANIRRLSTGKNGAINLFNYNGGNDSLSYWIKKRKEPATYNVINRAPIPLDTLVKVFSDDLKMMNFEDQLYIIYKNEKETPAYEQSGFQENRPPDVGNAQVTVISLAGQPIKFYASGAVYDPRTTIYSGYWAYEKMADLVPLDYLKGISR